MTADTMTKDETIRLQAAEVERLREAVKFLNSFRPDAELAKRDAEIERLREENSTFSDSLAAKADRIDRLGEAVARQVTEIERLRGLVYYVLPSEPFASDGITWKQESERLLNLLASEQELRLGPR